MVTKKDSNWGSNKSRNKYKTVQAVQKGGKEAQRFIQSKDGKL